MNARMLALVTVVMAGTAGCASSASDADGSPRPERGAVTLLVDNNHFADMNVCT